MLSVIAVPISLALLLDPSAAKPATRHALVRSAVILRQAGPIKRPAPGPLTITWTGDGQAASPAALNFTGYDIYGLPTWASAPIDMGTPGWRSARWLLGYQGGPNPPTQPCLSLAGQVTCNFGFGPGLTWGPRFIPLSPGVTSTAMTPGGPIQLVSPPMSFTLDSAVVK